MNMPLLLNENTAGAFKTDGDLPDQRENVETLFHLIQSQRAGQGVLPYFLALTPSRLPGYPCGLFPASTIS